MIRLRLALLLGALGLVFMAPDADARGAKIITIKSPKRHRSQHRSKSKAVRSSTHKRKTHHRRLPT